MDGLLVLAASLGYLLATLIYGAWMMRFSARWAHYGRIVSSIAAALHVGGVVARIVEQGFTIAVYDVLLGVSALAVIVWLAARRPPSALVGAFLTPVVTMALYSLHVYDYESAVVLQEVAWVTPIHKLTSSVGFLVFAIAAVASVVQIVQEWRLKTKHVRLGAKSHLPSLPQLELIAHRALVIGFPIYSVGMALGAIWLARGDISALSRHFIMASFSWVLYAVTLHARIVVGLQGRRAAVLTLAAFVSALFVVLLSLLRVAG